MSCPKVLLIVEQCNPEWASVPLVGYNFFREINKHAEVTLVTHPRNHEAIAKRGYTNVIYTTEGFWTRTYYKLVGSLAMKIWPLYHTLTYPIYAEFNGQVYNAFKDRIQNGDFDLVHVITPMMPRYPVKTVFACEKVPFLLGPINGGVPFPEGFRDVAKKEFAQLNFLRDIGRWLLPGYRETYQKADHILSGSTYTLEMIRSLFDLPDSKMSLFFENGINENFLESVSRAESDDLVKLLFVGRLVPYKGADILIDALSILPKAILEKVNLTIVGDGAERNKLETQVSELKLEDKVQFTRWIKQEETVEYYRKSDIFCFPSIREFGGAVVMEAMACGLPCIVADNGGIGEYVTPETGFKIEPKSRDYLTKTLAEKIEVLVTQPELRQKMSRLSTEQARQYEWGRKGEEILKLYHQMLEGSKTEAHV